MHFTFRNRVPYNKLLTNRACSGHTGEYWPEVVTVRTERSEVRTKTTSGQYSPVRPSRSVSKRLLSCFYARTIKIFSLLFDAINCFSDRGSSTEIKMKHILAIEETLDLGFELEIESVEVLIPRSPRVAFASN